MMLWSRPSRVQFKWCDQSTRSKPPSLLHRPTSQSCRWLPRHDGDGRSEMSQIKIEIPTSVQTEHNAIHATLKEATGATGRVGPAAQALAKILHPHFVREEEIALPPLGLLSRLASGDFAADMADILPMTDALKRELPQMLEEHKAIRAAVENLRVAARADNAEEYERLASDLASHAQTEEELLYPAAILVGEIIRARLRQT